jgi:hypothetical protein
MMSTIRRIAERMGPRNDMHPDGERIEGAPRCVAAALVVAVRYWKQSA